VFHKVTPHYDFSMQFPNGLPKAGDVFPNDSTGKSVWIVPDTSRQFLVDPSSTSYCMHRSDVC
jgi:hypothetical protein